MLEPYRMIVVNIIAITCLSLGLIFYKYIYPKKNINIFILLLLISIPPIISILRKGSYESGDLTIHAKYAMQFYDNIIQGNFNPEWMGNHCVSFGCPEYIFIFKLPYYIVSLFHFIGFSFIASVKILLITSFFASGVGMYLWIKDEIGKIPGFVAAVFYLFSPYHLIDLHFRVSIGEITSMAILPFLFMFTKKLIIFKKINSFMITATLFALLILAHQVTALISFPLLILYGIFVWFKSKQKRYLSIFLAASAYAFGILLSAFSWIPMLVEENQIWYGKSLDVSFHPISSFLYSPNRFGLLFQGHMGELYLNVGYTQWFILFLSIYLLIKNKIKKNNKTFLILLITAFSILFISMQSFTKPLWDWLPLAKSIQFSWRLLIETSLIISIIAGIVVKNVNSKKFTIIICVLTILYTILNWGNRKTDPTINDALIRNQSLYQEYPGTVEFTTPTSVDRNAKWIGIYPKSHIEVYSGKADIVSISRSMTKHQYLIVAHEDSLIKENTYYYPGWELFLNNKRSEIYYNNQNFKGVISFYLKKGIYKVRLIFVDTPDRILGNVITLTSFLFFFIFLFFLRPIRNGFRGFWGLINKILH